MKLHKLGYFTPRGALNIANSSSYFNPSSGLASFNNLAITSTGMYLLLFNVSTVNSDDYSFSCYSNKITILNQNTTLPTYTPGTEPNYILKFQG